MILAYLRLTFVRGIDSFGDLVIWSLGKRLCGGRGLTLTFNESMTQFFNDSILQRRRGCRFRERQLGRLFL